MKTLFGIWILFLGIFTHAQVDTTKKRVVEVSSTFKPSLREAAKINMNATPPVTDTTKPRLQYNLPDQNLLFAFSVHLFYKRVFLLAMEKRPV
jgi:hypothetical protein